MIITEYLHAELCGDNIYPYLDENVKDLCVYQYDDYIKISIENARYCNNESRSRWLVNKTLPGYAYNNILAEVTYFIKILIDENKITYDTVLSNTEVSDGIKSIITDNSKNSLIEVSISEVFWNEEHCPMFYLNYINSKEYYKEGIYFAETGFEVYTEVQNKLLKRRIPDTYEGAAYLIKMIYDIYVNDNCVNDFWFGYADRISNNDSSNITTYGKHLYFDGKEIIL